MELYRHREMLSANDKKGEFKQERMFGSVSKIPIANTLSELVEMDSVYNGDYAAFLHIRDTFSRYSLEVFTWAKKKGEQTAEMALETSIPNWLSVFGAPYIWIADKDMGFIGNIFQDFCSARNVALQTIIPGHRPSLGAAERRRCQFRTTIDHIVGHREENCSTHKEWKESPSMTMMHLNSQVPRLGGPQRGNWYSVGLRKCRLSRLGIRISGSRESKGSPRDENTSSTWDNSPNSTGIFGGVF